MELPLGCETHVDSGIFTILYQNKKGGLQVQNRKNKKWYNVPFNKNALVVNTGRALEYLSKGKFKATNHRVLWNKTKRMSIPFFFEPSYDFKMNKLSITPSKVSKFSIKIAKDGVFRSANEILTQKGVDMRKIRDIWPEIPFFDKEIDAQIEINAHYKGYLKKQKADILAFKRDENLIIPDKINYDELSGLSNEVKTKFKQIKPRTMGQALRIDGITPAAVYILLSHVKRKSIKHIA